MADLTYALTLIQPWAFCVARAGKRIENRSWVPHIPLGSTLAIHAGAKVDRQDCAALRREGVALPATLTTSAIVAVVRLVDVLPDLPSYLSLDQRRWWIGPIGWVFDEVVPLREPVPCKGRLGLWKMGEAVRDEVMRQIEVAHG